MELFALSEATLRAQDYGDILQGQRAVEAGAFAIAVERIERLAVHRLGLGVMRGPVKFQALGVPFDSLGSGARERGRHHSQ